MDKFVKMERKKDSGKESIEVLNSDSSFEASNLLDKGTLRKGSEVWSFFVKAKDVNYDKCLICSRVYKTGGNTSNLFYHLKRAHPTYR